VEPSVCCPVCSKSYCNVSAMEAHRIMAHTDNKICPTCEKKNRDKHLDSHYVYECFTCHSRFPQSVQLKKHHFNEHNAEQYSDQFVCSYCDKTALRATLLRHIVSNHKEPPSDVVHEDPVEVVYEEPVEVAYEEPVEVLYEETVEVAYEEPVEVLYEETVEFESNKI
jgi:hypothetical protein